MPETVLFVLVIIGTISSAVSGTIAAVQAKFDLFGVVFISVITATGGGIIRDVLIGEHPPILFSNFYLFLTAVITSVIFCIVIYRNRKRFDVFRGKAEFINNFFDAVGLAAFCVVGTEIAFAEEFGDNMFFPSHSECSPVSAAAFFGTF